MNTCHRYKQCVPVDCNNIPRRRQSLNFRFFISFPIKAFLACSNHCEHFLFCEIYFPYSMILSVTEVNIMLTISTEVTKTLRVMEGCLFKHSIHQSYFSIPYSSNTIHGFFIYKYQSIISSIRDDY